MQEARHLSVVQVDVQGVDVRPGALRYYEWLLTRAGADGIVTVSEEEAATAQKVDVRTIRRWKQILITTDCIGVSRFGNRPNEYRLRRSLEATAAAVEVFTRRVRTGSSAGSSSTVDHEAENETINVLNRSRPLSGAEENTQPLRAGDTTPSWSSSAQDSQDMSGSTDPESEAFLHQVAVLQDPDQLLVAGLIRAAGMDDSGERGAAACRAMARLTAAEQREALRRALKAREPNPDFLIQCCNTVLNLRGTTLPSPLASDVERVPAAPGTSRSPLHEAEATDASSFIEVITRAVLRAVREESVMPKARPKNDHASRPKSAHADSSAFRAALGNRLRAARADRTQTDIAKAAGITQAALSMYEGGTREPNTARLVALSKALGVPASELLP